MRQLKITKSITNRDSLTLDKYLHDISREDLITSEEEVVLAVKIRDGDERALEKLVRANLRFVVSVSKQYQNQGLTLPDLINEGNLGLIKAAQRFDETRGFKFISYAVWWIRQSIISSIAENSRMIRLPLNKVGNLTKIKRGVSELEQRVTSVEETILVSSLASASSASSSSKQSLSSTLLFAKLASLRSAFVDSHSRFIAAKTSKENEIKRLHDRLEKVLFQIAVVGVLKREDEKNGYQNVPFGRSARAIARDCLVLTFSFGNR